MSVKVCPDKDIECGTTPKQPPIDPAQVQNVIEFLEVKRMMLEIELRDLITEAITKYKTKTTMQVTAVDVVINTIPLIGGGVTALSHVCVTTKPGR